MLMQTRNRLIFQLEQLMVRGPVARFGFVSVLLLLVTFAAGLLIRLLVPGFESVGDSIWWAFEHVLVPEYTDSDEGAIKRTVATFLIVIGSILFAGSVIAILVQWLDDTTARLEMGLTPVRLGSHIVLLGWTNRTPIILEEIMVSQGRVARFLRRRGTRRLRVALLAELADATLAQQLRAQLGELWNGRQIILRNGSPLSLDGLERVDFAHASTILLPAADTTASSTDADARAVKTLMTIGAALENVPQRKLPLVVAELQDPNHSETLRALYGGAMEIIVGDEIISGLMVQSIRHPGLSYVYTEFLSDSKSSQIYVRKTPGLTGVSVQQLTHAFAEGVLLGVVRPRGEDFKALMNPPDDLQLRKGDRIVVLAPSYNAASPPEKIDPISVFSEKKAPRCEMPAHRRVLILGWNHRVPALLREFSSYPEETFAIDIVSRESTGSREKRIAAEGLPKDRLAIRHMEFDYTVPAYLQDVDPAEYDNIALLLSERFKSGAESDARAILGYLLLQKRMMKGRPGPPILIELTDPDNVRQFEKRSGEIILSPFIISHMLTRVGLRRELRAVFEELFSSKGSEIYFHRIADYGLTETLSRIPGYESLDDRYTFRDLQRVAKARGQTAIGIRRASRERMTNGGVQLNPKHDEVLDLEDSDELIVLATRG